MKAIFNTYANVELGTIPDAVELEFDLDTLKTDIENYHLFLKDSKATTIESDYYFTINRFLNEKGETIELYYQIMGATLVATKYVTMAVMKLKHSTHEEIWTEINIQKIQ